jgi:hypothetical protein
MWRIKTFIAAWMEYPSAKKALSHPHWTILHNVDNRFGFAKEMVRIETIDRIRNR